MDEVLQRPGPATPKRVSASTRPPKKLSKTQIRILSQVARGKKNYTIATDLDLHPKTVEKHLKSIRTKLRAQTTVHAVAIACHSGIIVIDELDNRKARQTRTL